MLKFDKKQQNSVKQLSFNKKNKKKKYRELRSRLAQKEENRKKTKLII